MSELIGHLSVTAEVSAAYIGFVAIFLMFARQGGRFSPDVALQIVALFSISFVSLFMSLVPMAVTYLDLKYPHNLRLCSGIALTTWVIFLGSVLAPLKRLTPEQSAKIGFMNNVVAWSCAGLGLIILFVNTVDLNGWTSNFLYFCALILGLVIATSNFFSIAIERLLKAE